MRIASTSKWFGAVLALALSACTTVPPGYVGIKFSLTGSQREITTANVVVGRVTYNPFSDRVVTYPTTVQRIVWTKAATEGSSNDDSFTFNSADGATVNADVAISAYVKAENAPGVFTRYRKSMDQLIGTFLRDRTRDVIVKAASVYPAEQIMGVKRSQLTGEIEKALRADLSTMGLTLESFAFVGELRPDEKVKTAISAKIAAIQEAAAAENQVRKVRAEAEQRVAQARGNAQAVLLQAQSQAKANLELSKSITPELVTYKALEVQQEAIGKWDGKLPSFQGGGAIPFINITPPK